MEIIYTHCASLDVHKQTVVVCLKTPKGKESRTFGTMTASLLEMADWLIANQCQAVAMESTRVYWKPIYNILEATGMEILVVNAQHIKTFRVVKLMLKIPNGSRIFSNMVCCGEVLFRIGTNGNCGN